MKIKNLLIALIGTFMLMCSIGCIAYADIDDINISFAHDYENELLIGGELFDVRLITENTTDEDKNILVNMVLYGSDGSIKSYTYLQNTIPAGASQFIGTGMILPDDVTDHILKIFAWDNLDSMKPISNTLSVYPEDSELIAELLSNDVAYSGFEIKLSTEVTQTSIFTEEVTYEWHIISSPEGSDPDISYEYDQNITAVFDIPGEYVVEVTVNDGFNEPLSLQKTIICKDFANSESNTNYTDKEAKFTTDENTQDFVALTDGWIFRSVQNANRIDAYNLFTDEIGKSYETNWIIGMLKFDFENNLLYAVQKNNSNIQIIDVVTDESRVIEASSTVYDIEFIDNEKAFALLDNGKLIVLDTVTGEELSSIDVDTHAGAVEYSKVANKLFVANYGLSPSTLYSLDYDIETNSMSVAASSRNLGGNGSHLAISDNGKYLAFCCGGGNGKNYTVYCINTDDITKKYGEWDCGAYPSFADFIKDDSKIVISTGSELKVFDTSTFVMENEKVYDAESVVYSRDGKYIIAVDDKKGFIIYNPEADASQN